MSGTGFAKSGMPDKSWRRTRGESIPARRRGLEKGAEAGRCGACKEEPRGWHDPGRTREGEAPCVKVDMQQGLARWGLKAPVKNWALVFVGVPRGVAGRGGSLQGLQEQSPRPIPFLTPAAS